MNEKLYSVSEWEKMERTIESLEAELKNRDELVIPHYTKLASRRSEETQAMIDELTADRDRLQAELAEKQAKLEDARATRDQRWAMAKEAKADRDRYREALEDIKLQTGSHATQKFDIEVPPLPGSYEHIYQIASQALKSSEAPRCKCGKPCRYYGTVGGYSVACGECDDKNAKRQREARARKKHQ
jgi:multidrug efflux pump subunit AcrA (membrane-fusion protein)